MIPAYPRLVFHLQGRPVALPLAWVRSVARLETVQPAPGSPPGVAGVAEQRGRLLSVVDVPALLGAPLDGDAWLVELAPPHGGFALRMPPHAAVERSAGAGGAPSAPAELLDLQSLLGPLARGR